MLIRDFIKDTTAAFSRVGIVSPRLDTLVLLCDELKRDKAWLLAHDDESLTGEQLLHLDAKIKRRLKREPLSYIRGFQEFYGRRFAVNPNVLIPRPETEALIELLPKTPGLAMIDVGTGSGVIAITAKLENPTWEVHASDFSLQALEAAKLNARQLGADITFFEDFLLDNNSSTYDVIAANLPYVSNDWDVPPELSFEPPLALYARQGTTALIQALIEQTPLRLNTGGYLLLESDPEQHAEIILHAQRIGLEYQQTLGYITLFKKG